MIEGLASDHETRILSLETSLDNLRKENKSLKFKINDLEGRLRRNHIRIIGIPEGSEKRRPTEFVADLIKQLFVDFSDPPVIDRAQSPSAKTHLLLSTTGSTTLRIKSAFCVFVSEVSLNTRGVRC